MELNGGPNVASCNFSDLAHEIYVNYKQKYVLKHEILAITINYIVLN